MPILKKLTKHKPKDKEDTFDSYIRKREAIIYLNNTEINDNRTNYVRRDRYGNLIDD